MAKNSKQIQNVFGQEKLLKELNRIFSIFKASDCEIKPHFILTGQSGTGKSLTIHALAEQHEIGFLEINAAQLTKEGVSGNSLSKALSPIINFGAKPTVVFVDEFDKLFISNNSNASAAHEATTGVQNEFLKVLETKTTSVYGDYGKYVNIPTDNLLFVFAGAFNGEEDLNIDRLREIGIKTEFLGRVGLVYNTKPLSLEDLFKIVETSPLLDKYCRLFADVDKETVVYIIKGYLQRCYEMNTLGARLINTLIHQYFIKGALPEEEVKTVSFQKKLLFKDEQEKQN